MGATYKTIIGPDWQWAEDYLFGMATYVLACQPTRHCEVGMGFSVFNRPRGQSVEFFGEREILVLGAGSLHFRVLDGQGPCTVAFAVKSKRPLSWSWPSG